MTTTTTNEVDYDAMDREDFADAMLDKLLKEDAVFQKHELVRYEKTLDDSAASRRMALAMLTMPYRELEEKVRNDKAFAISVAKAAKTFDHELYRQTAELVEKAQIHIMVALTSREDMQSIYDEADTTAATA